MRNLILYPLVLILAVSLWSDDDRQSERNTMVRRQIENRGITDPATLRAMRNVQRHLFVPESHRRRAYNDSPLPIGFGQTISQPYIVAFMTETVKPQKGQRVLEIGTGSGYQAAVLAEIVAEVYTIEIVPQLAQISTDVLAAQGYKNVFTKAGDGYYGWEEHAPYDAIIVTAAAESIPAPLIAQLKDGGKMIIPVGSPFMVQNLILLHKEGDNVFTESLMPVRFVPFTRD